MALSIKDDDADRLARELAMTTGESLTTAIRKALAERLKRVPPLNQGRSLADELNEIAERCAARLNDDLRTPDEIIGYNIRGET